MSSEETILGTIEQIYDAAMDESLWPVALQGLTDLTRSQAATFWVLDGSDEPRLPIFVYVNFDPDFVAEYLDETAPLDPTVQYLVAHPDQRIVHDGLVISEREKKCHPYYDWHDRNSETHYRLVGQMCPALAMHAGVALHRTRKAGAYDRGEIEQFGILYRHIERALAIGFRLGALGAAQQCTMEILDRNPAGIVLLDARKQLVYLNSSAEALCSSNDGIELTGKGIALTHSRSNGRLQCLIAEVLSKQGSPHTFRGGGMAALRPSGKRPYAILVTPVGERYPGLTPLRPAVCILIRDPEHGVLLPVERLREVFGLTGAEARLAVLLAAGTDLRSAAERLHITYGTARTRLAEIFHKTSTRRQAELVKVLLTTTNLG